MARDSLRTGSTPSTKIVLRHIKSTHDSATQILNELGTTDVAIGVYDTTIVFTFMITSIFVLRQHLIKLSLRRTQPQKL